MTMVIIIKDVHKVGKEEISEVMEMVTQVEVQCNQAGRSPFMIIGLNFMPF